MKNDHFYGMNAFADLDYWQPHYPKDVQSIVAKRNAIEIIRELVMKVSAWYQNDTKEIDFDNWIQV